MVTVLQLNNVAVVTACPLYYKPFSMHRSAFYPCPMAFYTTIHHQCCITKVSHYTMYCSQYERTNYFTLVYATITQLTLWPHMVMSHRLSVEQVAWPTHCSVCCYEISRVAKNRKRLLEKSCISFGHVLFGCLWMNWCHC